MSEGLAQMMTYGSGEGQNTKHHYAGTVNKGKKKMACKKKSKGSKGNK